MGLSRWHNKFFILPYISINVEKGSPDVGFELGWLRWSAEYIMNRENKEAVDNFYCELEGNFAHDNCKNQCKQCDDEYQKW